MAWNATQSILIARAQALLQPQLVLGAVANKPVVSINGSVAKVAVTGAVSVVDYTPGSDLTVNNLATTTIDINMNNYKAFVFSVDTVNQAQTNPATLGDVIDKALQKGTYGVANEVEDALADLYDSATMGPMSAVSDIDKTNILDFIGDVRAEMRAAGALMPGSWLVLPDTLESALVNALVNLPQNANAVLSNGYVGTVYGLDIYISTKLALGTTPATYAFAGCPDAISYVGQIATIERASAEKQFADIYKGLFTYGYEVTNPAGFLAVQATAKA